MKAYGTVEIDLHAFSFSMLDGREGLASRLGRFITRERVLVTLQMGDGLSLRNGLDRTETYMMKNGKDVREDIRGQLQNFVLVNKEAKNTSG